MVRTQVGPDLDFSNKIPQVAPSWPRMGCGWLSNVKRTSQTESWGRRPVGFF